MPMAKSRTRKCEDGVKRQFVRRSVKLVEVWNATLRQYEQAGKAWNEATMKGDAPSIQFHEGALSAFTASIHILRHLKDKDVFELPKDIPEYLDLEEIDQRLAEHLKKLGDEKDDKGKGTTD